MKVSDYACIICKEKLVNLDELIGMTLDTKTCDFRSSPIETAGIHVCLDCLRDMSVFYNDILHGETK